jgi:hypothetical protein
MAVWPSVVGYGLAAGSFIGAAVGFSSVPNARSNANSTADQIRSKGGTCPPPATGPTSTQAFVDACKTYSDDLNLINTNKTVGWVFVGVGSALFVASTVYLVVAVVHNSHAEPTVNGTQLVPVVGPSLSGLVLSGTF